MPQACDRCDRKDLILREFQVVKEQGGVSPGLKSVLCHGCMAEINENRIQLNKEFGGDMPILNWRRDGKALTGGVFYEEKA